MAKPPNSILNYFSRRPPLVERQQPPGRTGGTGEHSHAKAEAAAVKEAKKRPRPHAEAGGDGPSESARTAKKAKLPVEDSGAGAGAGGTTTGQLSWPSPSPSASGEGARASSSSSFPHLHFAFLQPSQLKDSKGRGGGDADYDPGTLHVPRDFLDRQTPAQRQWWQMKSDHFDTVLFFKMGKFYELFHMDAVIGVEACQLVFMKKDYAHCGFPESAFERYANLLVDQGYKVARIEQVETPKMMEARCRRLAKATKFDKVVRRKICQTITVGTRTFHESHDDILVAVCDDFQSDTHRPSHPQVGLCLANPTIGQLFFGQFTDNAHYTRTATLLTVMTPSELLCQKTAQMSPALNKVIGTLVSITRKSKSAKFPPARETLTLLTDKNYFPSTEWPESIQCCIKNPAADPTGALSVNTDSELALSSLGSVVIYMENAFIDRDILSLNDINGLNRFAPVVNNCDEDRFVHLFGDTLKNLDVLPSPSPSPSPSAPNSLFQVLNKTCSSPGHRLLKQWVCNPLIQPEAVQERQLALQDLHQLPEMVQMSRTKMKKMCDFERNIAALFSASLKRTNCSDHPDLEAVFYENAAPLKKKITMLIGCLKSFQACLELLEGFGPHLDLFQSPLLLRLFDNKDLVQHLRTTCHLFRDSFDLETALQNGTVIPLPGVDGDYDEAEAKVQQSERAAENYRQEQSRLFGCEVSFWGTGANCLQIEVSEKKQVNATSDHVLSSQRKGFKRYITPQIEELRERKHEAEEARRLCLEQSNRKVFEQFCSYKTLWKKIVEIISTLDCLVSLHDYSYNLPGDCAFPTLLETSGSGSPVLTVKNGRHPLLINGDDAHEVIPNDLSLDDRLIVLTGANMGGKSTLMRQTALLVILAQLGCQVPAEEMTLTPVDRIFSRMGAADRMMAGESTFFVELAETSNIVKNVTSRSLVLIDELGRGTTTYDGCAIASAVMEYLVGKRCRTIFSTHYHELAKGFTTTSGVRFCHMKILDPTEDGPLTFLYKLAEGQCSKSHGFNAATFAGIPESIVDYGRTVAQRMEEQHKLVQESRQLFNIGNI